MNQGIANAAHLLGPGMDLVQMLSAANKAIPPETKKAIAEKISKTTGISADKLKELSMDPVAYAKKYGSETVDKLKNVAKDFNLTGLLDKAKSGDIAGALSSAKDAATQSIGKVSDMLGLDKSPEVIKDVVAKVKNKDGSTTTTKKATSKDIKKTEEPKGTFGKLKSKFMTFWNNRSPGQKKALAGAGGLAVLFKALPLIFFVGKIFILGLGTLFIGKKFLGGKKPAAQQAVASNQPRALPAPAANKKPGILGNVIDKVKGHAHDVAHNLIDHTNNTMTGGLAKPIADAAKNGVSKVLGQEQQALPMAA